MGLRDFRRLNKFTMQKAHYALAFMALCGVVLVVHELQGPEVLKQNEDPFLAALEKHVVATAQRRLSKVFAEEATKKHIAEARKQIQASLHEADDDNKFRVKKAEAEMQLKEMQAAAQPIETVSAAKVPHAKKTVKVPVKKFTIAQLEAGEDAIEHKAATKKAETQHLMANLVAAPKVAPLSSEDNKYMKKEQQMEEKPKKAPEEEADALPTKDSAEEEKMSKELDDDDDDLLSEASAQANEREGVEAPALAAVDDLEKEDTTVEEKPATKKPVAKKEKAVKKAAPKKAVAQKAAETVVAKKVAAPKVAPEKDIIQEELETAQKMQEGTTVKDDDSQFEYKDDDDDFDNFGRRLLGSWFEDKNKTKSTSTGKGKGAGKAKGAGYSSGTTDTI